jgi:hypothetical protein
LEVVGRYSRDLKIAAGKWGESNPVLQFALDRKKSGNYSLDSKLAAGKSPPYPAHFAAHSSVGNQRFDRICERLCISAWGQQTGFAWYDRIPTIWMIGSNDRSSADSSFNKNVSKPGTFQTAFV